MFALLAIACDARPLFERAPAEPAADPARSMDQRGRLGSAPGNVSPGAERLPCPDAVTGHEAALEAADRYFESAELGPALACAELAADYAPQSVEAHHLRAAALSTMGRLAEAQVAFAMALALDPDDPETLAAVADFYINVSSPRGREELMLGLEYARRGSERAATRRRSDRGLRARLALLGGAAWNDLGSSDLALSAVKEAQELSPGWIEADQEEGVALFNLCRFAEAEAAFGRVTAATPTDPYANYYLGLIYERTAPDRAEKHFAISREVAPREYPRLVSLTDAEFRAEFDRAIAELEASDKKILEDIVLEVAALPAIEDLLAVEPPFSPTIAGLYRGLPVGVSAAPDGVEQASAGDVMTSKDGDIPARAIVLYSKNLIRSVRDRAELDAQIRRTLLHELGHAKGLDEDELRRLGLE